jgi:hypothetical protein
MILTKEYEFTTEAQRSRSFGGFSVRKFFSLCPQRLCGEISDLFLSARSAKVTRKRIHPGDTEHAESEGFFPSF